MVTKKQLPEELNLVPLDGVPVSAAKVTLHYGQILNEFYLIK